MEPVEGKGRVAIGSSTEIAGRKSIVYEEPRTKSGPWGSIEEEREALLIDMEERREELALIVGSLMRKVRKTTNWKYFVRKFPMESIFIALALGYYLGR